MFARTPRLGNTPSRARSPGTAATPAATTPCGRPGASRDPRDLDLAAVRQAPGQQRRERLTSRPGDARHAHDLARRGCRSPARGSGLRPAAGPGGPRPGPARPGPPGACAGVGDDGGVTHDQLGQPALVDLGPRHRGRDTAVPQHGDPVRDVEDLAQVVRDQQHAVAFGAQPADRLEQPAHLVGGQGGRRLVEHDEQPPVPGVRQGPRDRDRAALAHAERADRRPDIGLHADPAQIAAGPVGGHPPPDPAAQADRIRAAQHHVVEDAQRQHQSEILVDEAQARPPAPRGCCRAGTAGRPVRPRLPGRAGGTRRAA